MALAFRSSIQLARTGQSSGYGRIATVGDALQIVRSLLPDDREKAHWQRAECMLAQAAECPTDATLLNFCESAFREALQAEGWLKA
jgi:hypothetical protein